MSCHDFEIVSHCSVSTKSFLCRRKCVPSKRNCPFQSLFRGNRDKSFGSSVRPFCLLHKNHSISISLLLYYYHSIYIRLNVKVFNEMFLHKQICVFVCKKIQFSVYCRIILKSGFSELDIKGILENQRHDFAFYSWCNFSNKSSLLSGAFPWICLVFNTGR